MTSSVKYRLNIDIDSVDDLLNHPAIKEHRGQRIEPIAGEVLKELPIPSDGGLLVSIYLLKENAKYFATVVKTDPGTFVLTLLWEGSVTDVSIWQYAEDGNAYHRKADSESPRTKAEMLAIPSAFSAMKIFFDRVRENQEYPFHVTATNKALKSPIKSKRKQAEQVHDTIVYLGKPPTEKKASDGEGESLKFGYPRREFYKTLRHERFRHHPMYGVYHGVKVRQTWCGPKEYKVRDRIYKLYEHEAA